MQYALPLLTGFTYYVTITFYSACTCNNDARSVTLTSNLNSAPVSTRNLLDLSEAILVSPVTL